MATNCICVKTSIVSPEKKLYVTEWDLLISVKN